MTAARDDLLAGPTSSQPAAAKGDRTISPAGSLRSARRADKALIVAATALGLGALAAMTWDTGTSKRKRPPEPPQQVVAFEAGQAMKPPQRSATTQADVPPQEKLGEDGTNVPPLEVAADKTPTGAASALRPTLRQAPLMVFAATRSARQIPATLSGELTSPGSSSNPDQVRGSNVATARAARIGNRDFLILAGATVPCLLHTALDSTAPGQATCIIPVDVYSDNGAVLLLERGTRVLGHYRADMARGRRRLAVIWSRAVTPGGVAIALSSPAADGLGRVGIDGEVDTHFWDRFGGALMLSLVDDGAEQAFGDRRGRSSRLPSDAAAIAVEGSNDIPPTLRRAQGAELSILIAQDLDFSGVYSLRSR